MSVPPTMRESQACAPTQDAPDDVSVRRGTVKDLSFVSLVPNGAEAALPSQFEFFEIVEGSAKIGKWSEADQIQVCALKLTVSSCVLQRHTRTARSTSNLAGI